MPPGLPHHVFAIGGDVADRVDLIIVLAIGKDGELGK
jgi:hypothetical protein